MVLSIVSIMILTSIVVYSADAAGIPKKAISTVARFLESDLPTTTVFTDVANTFGSGQKQTFQNSATTAGLNLAASTDPSSLSIGDLWLSTTTANTLKYQASSGTQTVGALGLTQTWTGTNTFNALTLGGQMNLASNTLQSSGHVFTFPSNTGTVLLTNGSGTSLTGIVTSITGTANNLTASASTGAVTLNLGQNAVVNNKANTYTAGKKQTFPSDGTNAGVNLAGVASNPSSLAAGDLWRNTSIDSLMLQGSSTYTILSNHTFAQLYNPSNLVHAKSASVTMLGLGGSSSTNPLSFTPTTTGRVLITFSSTILSATSAKPYTMQFSYGTGTAPTTGATATGTTVGPAMIFSTPNNSLSTIGPMIASSVIITGLIPGTTYWADLRVSDANTSPITFGNIQVTINEI